MLVIGLHRALLEALTSGTSLAPTRYLTRLREQLRHILLSFFQILRTAQRRHLVATDEVLRAFAWSSTTSNWWGNEVASFWHMNALDVSRWYGHRMCISTWRQTDVRHAQRLIVLSLASWSVTLWLLWSIVVWFLARFDTLLGSTLLGTIGVWMIVLKLWSLRHESGGIMLFIWFSHAVATWEELSTLPFISGLIVCAWSRLCLLDHAYGQLGLGEHLCIRQFGVCTGLSATILRVANHVARFATWYLLWLRAWVDPATRFWMLIHLHLLGHEWIASVRSSRNVRLIIISWMNNRRVLADKSATVI